MSLNEEASEISQCVLNENYLILVLITVIEGTQRPAQPSAQRECRRAS